MSLIILIKIGIFKKAENKRIEIWNFRTSLPPRPHWCCDDETRGRLVFGAGSSARSPWHLGAGPAQSQNGCSFVPQRWQTYCIALCTRQTAGSCRVEFKGRPALAAAADWLCARLVTAGSTAPPPGWLRPVTSAGVGRGERHDACPRAPRGRFLPGLGELLGAGWRKGILVPTFRWAASSRTGFDPRSPQALPVAVTPYRVYSLARSWK